LTEPGLKGFLGFIGFFKKNRAVVGDVTISVRKMKLSLFLIKTMSLSVARQSRSQCMSALYSYGIAASPQVLLPMPLLDDMAF
jgi:hypothetical protein